MTRRPARRRAPVRHRPVFEVSWSDLENGDRIEHFEYGSGTIDGSGPAWIYITWDDVDLQPLSSHGAAIAKYLRRVHSVSDKPVGDDPHRINYDTREGQAGMRDENVAPVVPWALGRATERVHTVQLDYAHVDIDPVTQTSRFWAADGTLVEPIEAGKHGRITNTYQRTATSGDGGPGGGKQDSDTNVDGQAD